jgi:hypothetical protein
VKLVRSAVGNANPDGCVEGVGGGGGVGIGVKVP